jgi:hemerythrin-like domain-containing protein
VGCVLRANLVHELIVELQQYHRTKARHLFELETYVDIVSENESSETIAQTLRMLFEPFQDATEAAHHHNEELILHALRTTSAPIHRRVEEISGDHIAFERIIVQISGKLNNPTCDSAELCANVRRFVAIYKDHAEGEENIFFPIADKHLKVSHWRKIRNAWK